MFSTRFAVATLPRVSRLSTRPVIARAYHEKVISHYEHPRNVRITVAEAFYPAPYLIIGFLYAGGFAPQG